MKNLVLFSIFFCFQITVNAQTLAARLSTAKTIYVQNLTQDRVLIKARQTSTPTDWYETKSIESSIGDTLFNYIVHFKMMDPAFVMAVNNEFTSMFKKALPEGISFQEDTDAKPNTYFKLEISINNTTAKNQINLSRNDTDLTIACKNTFHVNLYEMQSTFNKPKKVISLTKTDKYTKVEIEDLEDASVLKSKVEEIEKIMLSQATVAIQELAVKSQKKIDKALSK